MQVKPLIQRPSIDRDLDAVDGPVADETLHAQSLP
jgi:hypothetical protein